jgi:tyrosine decarboxylase
MNLEEFRKQGKAMVDYICEYTEHIGHRQVMTSVEPGYLDKLIPREAPQDPEPFEDLMRDMDVKILPGMLHWNHPRFFAYYPGFNSYPSILADMLDSMIGSVGFSWVSHDREKGVTYRISYV